MRKKRSSYSSKELNTNDLLEQRKKQLRVDIIILILILLITLLLGTIAFKSIKDNLSDNDFIIETYEKIISNNVFDSIFGDKKDDLKDDDNDKKPVNKKTGDSTITENGEEPQEDNPGQEQGHEQEHDPEHHDHDDDADEYFKLSNRDSTHTENTPFNELIVPGDSETKKYAVEVKHKEAVKVYISLDNVTPTNDSVLDIIKLDISVNGTNKYSGTLKNFINHSVDYSINSTNSTDTVEYVIKASIDSNVTDNYSNNTDGNYQGKNVNFSLKWWVENEN